MAWFLVIMLVGQWGKGPPFRPRIRQRLENERSKFYQLLSEDEKVGLGCCLIPTTGCLIGLYNRFQKDTTKMVQKAPLESLSFWQRLRFGIGYSGGVCVTSEDLTPSVSHTWEFDPSRFFFLLNSIDVIVNYSFDGGHMIELGGEYGWSRLLDKGGLEMNVPNAFDTADGLLTCGGDWEIRKVSIFANKIPGLSVGPFYLGLEATYAEAKTAENLYEKIAGDSLYPWRWKLQSTSSVTRKCFGWGAFLRWEKKINLGRNISVSPFGVFKVSTASEYYNDADWLWDWNHKISLGFSGFYAGFLIIFGET